MDVKYKSTYELINRTIDYARDAQREIESITLDSSEWFAFHRENNTQPSMTFLSDPTCQYRGVTINRKER